MRAIVTVIGKDRVGIIAGVSGTLAWNQVNILDISQTILQEYFTMIMLVDLDKMSCTFDDLTQRLNEEGTRLGVAITIQREEIFQSMHTV